MDASFYKSLLVDAARPASELRDQAALDAAVVARRAEYLPDQMARVWGAASRLIETAQRIADDYANPGDVDKRKAELADILDDIFGPACDAEGCDMPWRDANTLPALPASARAA